MFRNTALVLLFPIILLLGCRKHDPTTANVTSQVALQSTPQPINAPSKIITKDPDYIAVVREPEGDDLVKTWSEDYKNGVQQIERKVAGIADQGLRDQQRKHEWETLINKNLDAFRKDAEESFVASRQRVLTKHRNGWFEVGHMQYKDGDLIVSSVDTSPLVMQYGSLHFPLDVLTMDSIYTKFGAVASDEIAVAQSQSRSEAEMSCRKNEAEGGLCPPMSEVYAQVDQEALEKVRSERLVLVGQGDLISHRVDKLMLVDYRSETVLADIKTQLEPAQISWRF